MFENLQGEEGLWVDYSMSDDRRSLYAASLLKNRRHRLQEEVETRGLFEKSGSPSEGALPAPGLIFPLFSGNSLVAHLFRRMTFGETAVDAHAVLADGKEKPRCSKRKGKSYLS